MTQPVGVWIDHRDAVIVKLADEGEVISRVNSDMAPHERFSAQAPEGSPEDRRDRRFEEHLHKYYDAVMAVIRDADAILIFGPGEAKREFAKRLEHERLGDRVVSVETADKLTDPQIAARVRAYFLK